MDGGGRRTASNVHDNGRRTSRCRGESAPLDRPGCTAWNATRRVSEPASASRTVTNNSILPKTSLFWKALKRGLRDCRINEFGQPRRERFWNSLGVLSV